MIQEPLETIISRAQSPKEGDTYTMGDDRVTVQSVGDGLVRYVYCARFGPHNLHMTIEDWHHAVRASVMRGAEVSFA
jgi:hypothetical protein